MSYLPMADLVQAARIEPGRSLADETHQSWPIPVLGEGRLGAAFLFAPCRAEPGEGQLLIPPTHLALLDATSGDLVELRQVSPADLAQADDPGAPLGFFALAPGMNVDQYLSREAEAFQVLDLLLPPFFAGASRLEPTLARLAGELQARYWALTAAPLHPYYRAVGRRFFTWLESVAA